MLLKKSLIKLIKTLAIGFTIFYPFIVFLILKKHMPVRFLALFLLTIAGMTFIRNKNIWIFACLLLLGTGLIIFNDNVFLKLYPVLMNINVGLMFALSLRGTPLIEKFAKKMGQNLNTKQKEYAKSATCAWAVFMLCLTIVSFITVFLSDEIWVLFNGLISYILIAIMMGTEFIIRKRFVNVHRNK